MTRKTNQENSNHPMNNMDLRPTVRLLILLALLKLTVLIGLSLVVSQLSDTVTNQGAAISRTDSAVQRVTSDDATRAQQIVLYKIFLAQCEGRQITNPEGFASTGDTTIQGCATRLFLAQPQLPADQFIVPSDANATK